MWRYPKCMLPCERSQSEKAMYCMIPMIRYSGKGKLWRQWKSSGYPGCGKGKMNRLGFLWLWKNSALCCTDICYYSSSQTHRVCNTQNVNFGASLVVQWIRTHLPMQEAQDQSLVPEDPTCCMATESVCCSFCACALEPGSCSYRSPHALQNMLCNKRSHCNEKPIRRNCRGASTYHN